MPMPSRRCFLIFAFGPSACRAATEAYRCLGARRTALIAVQTRRNRRRRVLAKPFAQRPWRTIVTGDIGPELLGRLTEAATSIRNHRAMIDEFGSCLGSVEFDVLVLVDRTDPVAMADWHAVLGPIAQMEILSDPGTSGLRILALLDSPDERTRTNGAPDVPPAASPQEETFTNHTFSFHTRNIDRFGLSLDSLASLAGRGLGHILGLDSDDPIRDMLSRPGAEPGWAMRYWSLGFATLTCQGAEFVRGLRSWHRQALKRTWLRPGWSPARCRAVAERLVHRLIDDGKIANADLPGLLARWAACFFRSRHGAGSPGATPADLRACLLEVVSDLSRRWRRLAADLPNFRLWRPRPNDTRGWLKRLLNRMTRNRLFKWEARWTPPPDVPTTVAARRARLRALDEVLLNTQSVVQRTLDTLRETPADGGLSQADAWPNTWITAIAGKLESRLAPSDAAEGGPVAKALLAGGDPLSVVQDGFIRAMKLPADANGLKLIAAVASLLEKSNERLLKEAVRAATEQAAPWWSEPLTPQVTEQVFLCLPETTLSSAIRKIEPQLTVVSWPRDAIGAFRLLRGCHPAQTGQALVTQAAKPPRQDAPPRTWISFSPAQS